MKIEISGTGHIGKTLVWSLSATAHDDRADADSLIRIAHQRPESFHICSSSNRFIASILGLTNCLTSLNSPLVRRP